MGGKSINDWSQSMVTTVVFVWKGKHGMKDIKRTPKDVELTFYAVS